MFSFQHINYFSLLAIIPILIALFFYVLKWKKKSIKKIGDVNLVNKLIQNYSSKKFTVKFLFVVVAIILCITALANLRSPNVTQKISNNGIDIMIALDVSKSMLAQDVKPNRLERAKQIVNKLIDNLQNNRVGLVLFAGKAYLQMPLTNDVSAAKMFVSTANTEVLPTQGTAIAEALKMCYAGFNSKEKKYKSVLLITDGEDHEQDAVKIATQMAEEGISINAIGIGSTNGVNIVDEVSHEIKKDKDGNAVVTKLNEDILKQLVQPSKGSYQFFTNTDEIVANLLTQFNSIDKKTTTESSLTVYRTYYQCFLAAALLLLVLEFFVSERKRKTLQVTFLVAALFFVTNSNAQNVNNQLKEGNKAYNKGEYEKAAIQYVDVLKKEENNKTALYNYGNAKYKATKIDDAIGAYDKYIELSTNKLDKAKAYYNKGVVYQNAKNLNDCIVSYKNALKLNPNDDDARQNLQKALQQQKQQQKQQQQNKKQQKPKEDENQKNKEKQKDEEQKNDEPKPQPSKLTKQDAEQKLKALLQQEKNLQDKLKKSNASSPQKPEKDW